MALITEPLVGTRERWRSKAAFFHAEDQRYLSFLIPEGARVLELGCGAGHTLAALKPARGVGVDLNTQYLSEGKSAFPFLEFHQGDIEADDVLDAVEGPFDFILLMDTLGYLLDCQRLLERLHRLCSPRTRLVTAYYSHLWHPLLKLAEISGWKSPSGPQNTLSPPDIRNLEDLAGFETIKIERRLLSPIPAFGLGRFANRFLAPLPGIRHLAFRHYSVARSREAARAMPESLSIIIPARNEYGNIERAVESLPSVCQDLEIIFVEGHSVDGTYEEMLRVASERPQFNIKVLKQTGRGKGDAVRLGFASASRDALVILDADLTVAPQDLGKFWAALCSGKGEFINGTRLVYPREKGAMRWLNLFANRVFSLLFSWLLNQRYTDTLCGTKAMLREDYQRLLTANVGLGLRDPFGDFDLIFGAAKLSLKTIEIPVRYEARRYGATQISRFRDGWRLLRLFLAAVLKLKAI